MRLFSVHKEAEREMPTRNCEHFLHVGEFEWFCSKKEHDSSESHYNDVIHSEWW